MHERATRAVIGRQSTHHASGSCSSPKLLSSAPAVLPDVPSGRHAHALPPAPRHNGPSTWCTADGQALALGGVVRTRGRPDWNTHLMFPPNDLQISCRPSSPRLHKSTLPFEWPAGGWLPGRRCGPPRVCRLHARVRRRALRDARPLGVSSRRMRPHDLPLYPMSFVEVGMPVPLSRNVAALHDDFEL